MILNRCGFSTYTEKLNHNLEFKPIEQSNFEHHDLQQDLCSPSPSPSLARTNCLGKVRVSDFDVGEGLEGRMRAALEQTDLMVCRGGSGNAGVTGGRRAVDGIDDGVVKKERERLAMEPLGTRKVGRRWMRML